jgi:hypothetical protein
MAWTGLFRRCYDFLAISRKKQEECRNFPKIQVLLADTQACVPHEMWSRYALTAG